MNSLEESKFFGRSGFPGLLFWQKLIPAFVFGILSIKWMLPSFVAFLIYIFLLYCFRLEKGAVVLLILLYCFGNWYGGFSLPSEPGPMPEWMAEREKVQVDAVVHSVQGVPGSRVKVLLEDVVCSSATGDTRLEGYLNWTWERPETIPFVGQRVSFYGRVKPIHGFNNSGLWDYGFYARTKNITYKAYSRGSLKKGGLKPFEPDFFQKLRADLRSRIVQNAPPTQGAAFFPALLTGDRFFLSYETVEQVRRAGISHVLALSGLHVGIIVSLGFALSWLVGLCYSGIYLAVPRIHLGIAFAAPLVLFYLWLGQLTPSLLRAVCMFGFWGILLFIGRGRVLLDGLFLAVALILSCSPLSVFDLGFQLSVLAVGGIALLYPRLQHFMPSGDGIISKSIRFILAVFYVSLCANISLMPVIIWNFGVITPNLLFNVIAVPAFGLFVVPVAGCGGLFFSYISPQISKFLFGLGTSFNDALLALMRWAADFGLLPEYVSYRPLWEDLLVYYLALGALLLFLNGERKRLSLLLIPVICLIVFRYDYGAEDGTVRMDLLDTGQSQCLVISGPAGTRTVVDGGGSFGNFDIGRSIVGPWLTYGRLPKVDNIFMSHGDRDHAGGLAFLLEKFRVGTFFYNGDMPGGKIGERFKDALDRNRIDTKVLKAGDIVELEKGLVLEVMHPKAGFEGSINDRSLYLRLVWNGKGLASIAGDVDKKAIKAILEHDHDMSADVLVLPHHGSRNSLSVPLYTKVDPQVALAACGFLNRFNFAAQSVISELYSRDVLLYRTSHKGQISVVWRAEGGLDASGPGQNYFSVMFK